MGTKGKVLVFDDDKEMRNSLADLLGSGGFEVVTQSTAADAEAQISASRPDVILSDVRMPGRSGLDVLAALDTHTAPPLVLISAHGDIDMAVDAMSQGAYSFLEKPFDPRRLLLILDHAAEQYRLRQAGNRLRERLADLSGLNRIYMGQTPVAEAVRDAVINMAALPLPVLITGETGTGKDLIARALHDLSDRADQTFKAMNCAAIPVDAFEAVMFGSQGGASGVLAQVDGGTLFLDEVSSAPPEVQSKLLRILEDQRFTPIGSDREQRSDFRLISALSTPPADLIADGRLREDFYYRLQRLELDLPSLRARRDDIVMLFNHFADDAARAYEIAPDALGSEDLAALMAHDWPGNVRELRAVAERWVLSARFGSSTIGAMLRGGDELDDVPETLRGAVAAFERSLIGRAIKAHEGRMDDTAAALGIGRRTLNEKIVKLGLDKDKILG